MFKSKTQKFTLTILTLLFCVSLSCVSPDAVRTDIQGVRNEQDIDNTVVAEYIDEINNNTEQTTKIAEDMSVWRKSVQAEIVNYDGAAWVVIGMGVVSLIFVGGGLLLIRAFMKRGNMLTMLTRAVKEAGEGSPETVVAVKRHLRYCVSEGHFCEQDRKNLDHFSKKVGTFVEQKST